MLCLIMALTVDISSTVVCSKFPLTSRDPVFNNVSRTNPESIVDHMILFMVELWICSLRPSFPGIPHFPKTCRFTHVINKVKRYNKRYSTMSKVSHVYTLWLFSINIYLIVVVNPTIVNPGPNKACPNISVYFQNVQGLIPFTELGKPFPKLDNTKLFELQAYVFHNNIDIVILNESWLTNDILNNEIFPNNAYKTFRVDRSILTHPLTPMILKSLEGTVVVS